MLPTANKGRLGLRGGAVNLKAANVAPAHVTTKSAEIMEEARVSCLLSLNTSFYVSRKFIISHAHHFCTFLQTHLLFFKLSHLQET